MIAVENLRVELGGRRVLDGVSISLTPGRVTALLGPNGAGKTTLLRAMAGLARPASGRVTLDGSAIETLDRREIARRLAVVFQEPPSEIALTIRDMVLLGRNPHVPWHRGFGSRDFETADRLVGEIGLGGDRIVSELSAGERQRVHLARALAQEPRALLMDEPAANLDLKHQLALLDRVRRLAAEGAAVLIILHDLNLAGRVADEAILLRAGRVLAKGEPAATLTPARIREAYDVDARAVRLEDGRTLYSF